MKKMFKKAISVLLIAIMVLCSAPLTGFVGLELPEIGGLGKLADSVSDFFERLAPRAKAVTSGTCGDNLTWTFDESTGELVISGTGDMWRYNFDHYTWAPWIEYGLSIKSIKITDGVTSISDYVFCSYNEIHQENYNYFYQNLASVTIPDSVTRIGKSAFDHCPSLESVIIPDSVTVIGDNSFSEYTQILCNKDSAAHKYAENNSLSYWLFDDDTQEKTISGKVGTKLTWSIDLESRKLTVENNGTMIAFVSENAPWKMYNVYITSAQINYGCTNISQNAFSNCTYLKSVDIPYSVTSIDDSAFYNCKSLENITIPDSVISIGDEAFMYCTSLASATIGNGVTSIGCSAFRRCESLAELTLGNSVESIGDFAFSMEYYNDYIGYELKSIIIPDSVEIIGDYAFKSCGKLESVIIGESVKSIGGYAFAHCTRLASVTIPDSVAKIGESAFFSCKSLASAVISDSVTSIGDYAFRFCENLKSITIPDGLKNIGNYLFSDCTSLESITIPDSVKSIGEFAFSNCTSLANITIGNGVTSIGSSAFYGCTGLETATIPDDVKSIGDSAFYNCDKLEIVTIGKKLTSMGKSAFANCPSLSDIYIYSKNCSIDVSSISIYPAIHAYIGSTAETFANKYGYEFIPIVDNPCDEHSYDDSCDVFCNVCGFKRTINHTFSEWETVKESTCKDFGVKKRTCSVCGHSEFVALEELKEHAYSDACDITCDICGEIRTTHHKFSDWITIKEATCAEYGEMERTCSACGSTETDYIAKRTEHTYINSCDTDCDVCGKTRIAEHKFGEWVVTKEPTCTETGTKERVCSVNGCVESEVIGSIPHTDEDDNGICEICNIQFEIKPVYSGTCGDNLTWTFDESTDELVISGTGDMTDWSDNFDIPWYVYSSSIKTITISDGVTSVGDYAFLGCYELTSVTIGNDVASIGYYSFGTCAKLKSITIPDGVTYIGNRAFAYCHNLRNVTIPDGVINIEPLAFLDSGYVTIICKNGSYAHVFAVQNGIKYILEDNNGTAFEIKNTVLLNYGGSAENVVLPADVTTVGIDAFKGNQTVKLIEIPYSVNQIHSGAFSDCPNLDGVVIPFTVTEISDSAFSGTNAKIYCYNHSYAYNYAVANGITYELITVTLSINGANMSVGDTLEVNAVPSITLASGVPFVWKSSDISVADIDENGKVTAKNTGETTISAIAPNGSILATCSVNVAPAEAVVADVIKKPTQTTISYGDAIILHVDASKIPEGGCVEWTSSNNNFSYKADGETCTISPEQSGDTVFTATIYDAKGNPVSTDEQTMTSKAGFFDKIIAFFKGIFGLTKKYPQVFKGII